MVCYYNVRRFVAREHYYKGGKSVAYTSDLVIIIGSDTVRFTCRSEVFVYDALFLLDLRATRISVDGAEDDVHLLKRATLGFRQKTVGRYAQQRFHKRLQRGYLQSIRTHTQHVDGTEHQEELVA